jgi:hypothetical protein
VGSDVEYGPVVGFDVESASEGNAAVEIVLITEPAFIVEAANEAAVADAIVLAAEPALLLEAASEADAAGAVVFGESPAALIPPLFAVITGDDGRSFAFLTDHGAATGTVVADDGESHADVTDRAFALVERG